MIIDCSKCSAKNGCICWEEQDFSKCWKQKDIVRKRRNMIAIEAMKAILSNPSVVTGISDEGPKIIANVSVMIADEMINLLK